MATHARCKMPESSLRCRHMSDKERAEVVVLWESGLYETLVQVAEAYHELSGRLWSTMTIGRAIDSGIAIPRRDLKKERSEATCYEDRIAKFRKRKELEEQKEMAVVDPRYPPFLQQRIAEVKVESLAGKAAEKRPRYASTTRYTRFAPVTQEVEQVRFRLPTPHEMAEELAGRSISMDVDDMELVEETSGDGIIRGRSRTANRTSIRGLAQHSLPRMSEGL
jgi:hypothetical protein